MPAPVNVLTAAVSTCAEPGKDPVGFVTTCADGAPLAVVPDKGEDAFCGDKRFGTLLFVEVGGRRLLYFCKSTKEAERFVFGETYPSAVIVHTDADIFGFALGAGQNYRCMSVNGTAKDTQVYDTAPLPRNEQLCAGFAVEDRSGGIVVTHSGKELARVSLTAASN